MKKRVIALTLGLLLVISGVGCGARKTVEIDTSKTTLTVGLLNGGLGKEWLEKAIEKFEKKYADTSFEEGKKGVQVVIGSYNQTTMRPDNLKEVIDTSEIKDEIFFTDGVSYSWWVKNGLLLDITDAVNEELTEFGEEGSVMDRIDEMVRPTLEIDGKVYALPFHRARMGMVYNATLWDEKGWYIGEDGSYTDAKGSLGAGPDGQNGTYDDGMPATYDEFFTLLDKIADDNCTPVMFSGKSRDYLSVLAAMLAADNMGQEQFMLNYNLNGTATLAKLDTVNWDTMEFETEEVAITEENGYELARQPGVLYATKFIQRLLQNDTYYNTNDSLSGSFSVSQAQLEFIRNPLVSGKKCAAILVEGSWWENEAAASFRETYGTDATKYDSEMEYKCMPLPKANESFVGTESTDLIPEHHCFIKSNIEPKKIEVAKKFLQFMHTNAQLEEFTQITGIMRPYIYNVDEEGMTSYSQSVVENIKNSKSVYPVSNNKLAVYQPTDFYAVQMFRSQYDASKEPTQIMADVFPVSEEGSYLYNLEGYVKGIYLYRKDTRWKSYEKILK